MNIPSEIKVGGKTYAVEKTDRISLGCDYSGEIDYAAQVIRIRPANLESQEQTFFHELFHAMYDFMGYKDHPEEVIDRFASTLHMIIKDNPEVFRK